MLRPQRSSFFPMEKLNLNRGECLSFAKNIGKLAERSGKGGLVVRALTLFGRERVRVLGCGGCRVGVGRLLRWLG
jgi:hypothetical protein